MNVFLALGIKHTMRMRRIVICGIFRSTLFFHIISRSHDTIFEKKKKLENKMCFGFLHKNSATFFIIGRTERDMIKNV